MTTAAAAATPLEVYGLHPTVTDMGLPMSGRLSRFRLPLNVADVDVELGGLRRDGTGTPLVFLHGFGSTKEDYVDLVQHPDLADRPVLLYDAPGCGASTCSALAAVDISFLVAVATAALAAQHVDRFHLIGHSMGGLTGLLLAEQQASRIATFIDIEGNVAPEDCFLSRQLFGHPHEDSEHFMAEFAEHAAQSDEPGSALYATSVMHKVRTQADRPIFHSIVDLSDHRDLLARYLELEMPQAFVHGEHNRHLSYLPQLSANGVNVIEIPDSGHWTYG